MPLLMIVSFFIFAYSALGIAETENALKSLRGNALKSFIADYAVTHIPHQEDEIVEARVMQVEPITLRSCAQDIELSISNHNSSTNARSVAISCSAYPQWNIFIPIDVKLFTDVLVANRLIMAGEVISASDVAYERRDRNQLSNGFFKDQQVVVGLVARYSLNAGNVLTTKNTKQLPVIKKNQPITLISRAGPVEVSMLGIAKTDGFINDTIKVLNPSSKKIIDAIVKDSNQAEINY